MANSQAIAVNINDACRALAIGRTSFYKLVGSGQIKTFTLAGRTLVAAADLHRLVDQARAQAGQTGGVQA